MIETKPGLDFSSRLVDIARDLTDLIATYRPTICGIEKLFFLRNVTNGIDVAQARGVVVYTLAIHGIPIIEYTPLQVKQGISGSGAAKKPQVQKSLMMVLRLSEIPRPDDAADALAIAYLTSLRYRGRNILDS